MRENRWLREPGVRDKRAACRVRAFGAGPGDAGAFACADDFQVSEASAIGVNLQNGSVVLYEGFSLGDALYFYVAPTGNYSIASRCFYLIPTVIAQYLPLALVAQQMARLIKASVRQRRGG